MFGREPQELLLGKMWTMVASSLRLEVIHPTGKVNLATFFLLVVFALISGAGMAFWDGLLRILEKDEGAQYPFVFVFTSLVILFVACLVAVVMVARVEKDG